MKTSLPKAAEIQERTWFLLDAAGKTPGQIATVCARLLQGKHKATFTNHLDVGDGVVVINVEQIQFSGDKLMQKKYRTHSGHLGHLKETSAGKLLESNPEKVLFLAVSGMLPKNRLRKGRLARLKVFQGEAHNMSGQKPEKFEF